MLSFQVERATSAPFPPPSRTRPWYERRTQQHPQHATHVRQDIHKVLGVLWVDLALHWSEFFIFPITALNVCKNMTQRS